MRSSTTGFAMANAWGWVRSVRTKSVALVVLSLLALTVACLPSPGAAQQPLVGVATDRETSAPLAGVYIALEAQAEEQSVAAALTDESGRFVLSAEVGAIYRLRAERVGLATEVTEWFTFEEGAAPRRISLVERAVELEGLSVSAPVRTCRLEPEEATVVQRWWDEVRKALKTTAFLQASEAEGFRFERFEREWTSNLRTLRSERYLPMDSVPSRPFLSPDAETLSELGFIQGVEGERWFFAPDAAVLFSETFLADHCFGIAEAATDVGDGTGGRAGELRLAIEPTRRDPPDIRGVLTVDTLSGELRSFDFRYVNLPNDIPRISKGGGHLTFEYLTSGEWIVSDWWIRMPQIGRPRFTIRGDTPGGPSGFFLAGYFDRGGRVVEVGGRAVEFGSRLGKGTLHGTVYDSLTGGPLAGARVSVVGSRLSTRTGSDGRFTLPDVPAGRHGLTFHHSELTLMGLPSPVVPVNVVEGSSDSVALATPGFAAVATWLCEDPTGPPAAILTGRVLDAVRAEPSGSAAIRASWAGPGDGSGAGRSMRAEGRSGSDGRYVFCDLPPDVPISLAVRTDSATWREAGAVELTGNRIVTKELRPGAEARAVVRGTVRTAEDGEPLAGTDVWLLAVSGDTVASARADGAGVFGMSVPAGVGYRVVAVAEGHAREASAAFTVGSAESLDVDFELVASVTDLAMRIEGLVVEVEARNRAVAKRLLRQYGQSPASLGRRWIDRAALSSLAVSGDPGVAIQRLGVPRVWVLEGAKYGRNPTLCVQDLRTRACAIIILNGVQIDPADALAIEFHQLEAIAVLTPADATTFFGTGAVGGAVLLWIQEGGR